MTEKLVRSLTGLSGFLMKCINHIISVNSYLCLRFVQICPEKCSDLSGKIFRFVQGNFRICPGIISDLSRKIFSVWDKFIYLTWVTRSERPKGAKDEVKQARRAKSRPEGPPTT